MAQRDVTTSQREPIQLIEPEVIDKIKKALRAADRWWKKNVDETVRRDLQWYWDQLMQDVERGPRPTDPIEAIGAYSSGVGVEAPEGGRSRPSATGVVDERLAERFGVAERDRRRRIAERPWQDDERFPGYTEQEVQELLLEPTRWSPADIGRLQRQLVSGGVLSGDFQYGRYDAKTRNAYVELLDFSFDARMTKNEALREWRRARVWAESQGIPWYGADGSEGTGPRRFISPVYEAPDSAEIAQDIKRIFRQTLGRDPREGELERFAAMLAAEHRAEFDTQVDVAKAMFDQQETERPKSTAEQIASQGGIEVDRADIGHVLRERAPIDVRPAGSQPGGTQPAEDAGGVGEVQAVNPLQRVLEAFEAQFADEIAVGRQVEQAQDSRARAAQMARTVSGLTGGL